MDFSVRLLRRDFSDYIAGPSFEMVPLRWGWKSIGGCDFAEIAIFGDANRLWDSLNYLRCPVEISYGGELVWWGYVSDVGYSAGPIDVAVSLKDMANKIAVAYSLVDAGSDTVGTRATTGWSSNSVSVGIYGTKELLGSTDGATAAQAESVRDRLLGLQAFPAVNTQAAKVANKTLSVGQYNRGKIKDRGDGRLVCKGWWNTLEWRYYSNAGTSSVDTATQLGAVIDASEWLSSDIIDTSGVSSSEYRDGDGTALSVAVELLKTQTSGGNRLTATVTRDRRVVVKEESASGESDWRITEVGLRDRWGAMPLPGISVLGWAQLQGVVPATANLAFVSAPSPLYIESNEYDLRENDYRWIPRGMPSPWDITKIEQG